MGNHYGVIWPHSKVLSESSEGVSARTDQQVTWIECEILPTVVKGNRRLHWENFDVDQSNLHFSFTDPFILCFSSNYIA